MKTYILDLNHKIHTGLGSHSSCIPTTDVVFKRFFSCKETLTNITLKLLFFSVNSDMALKMTTFCKPRHADNAYTDAVSLWCEFGCDVKDGQKV